MQARDISERVNKAVQGSSYVEETFKSLGTFDKQYMN